MTNKNDGGSAFPRDAEYLTGDKGMTLRQWYAGMALQGMRADTKWFSKTSSQTLAHIAFKDADAMIKEGEK